MNLYVLAVIAVGAMNPAFSQNSVAVTAAEKHLDVIRSGETICVVAAFNAEPQSAVDHSSMIFADPTGRIILPLADQTIRKTGDRTYKLCGTIAAKAYTDDYKLIAFSYTEENQLPANYRSGNEFSTTVAFHLDSSFRSPPRLESVSLSSVR